MKNYQDYIQRKQREYPGKFSEESLAKQFIPYFESGKRIEVKVYDEVKRGTIGITTGWRPCFLLMLRRNSLGSAWTLSEKDEVIKVITHSITSR